MRNELFDKKYVRCFWDDKFIGKKGFVEDYAIKLKDKVLNNDISHFVDVEYSRNDDFPFADTSHNNKVFNCFSFFYYDPNYEVKRAWLEGKDIQFTNNLNCEWTDLSYDSAIDFYSIEWDTHLWRIKPKEEYVPFETIDELIEAWEEKYPRCKDRMEGTEPLIWIRPKIGNAKCLIDYFNRDSNEIGIGILRAKYNMKELFDNWLFADVTVCGKKKE